MNKLFASALAANIVAPAVFLIGMTAMTTDAAACPTACGMKYSMVCKNGNTVYASSPESLNVACAGGSYVEQPTRNRQVTYSDNSSTETRTTRTRNRSESETRETASSQRIIRPRIPACVKGQKDFVRWSDPTLARYGLTIICDKNFGGSNLKPANSGEPTRLNGKIVRWGKKAPSANGYSNQVQGIGYYEQGGKLYVVTSSGTAVFSSFWGLSYVK